MRKEFIYNLIFVIGANILIKPLYIFGIDRTVQNIVGPKEYGLYFALFNFALLFQIITDVGLQNFNNRSISQSESVVQSFFPAILIIKTVLALGFLLVLFVAAYFIGYDGISLSILLWVAINTILVSFILYLRTNISGLGKYRLDSVLSILDKVLMIIIVGFMILSYDQMTIMDFIYGQTLALILSAMVIGVVVFQMIQPLKWPKSLVFPIDLLKRSAPYALVVLLMTIYTRIDGVMIERLLEDGALQAGIYASGYRFFDAANMLGFLAAGLLLPMFSKLHAKGDKLFPLYELGISVTWIVSVFLAVVCYVFRVDLVQLLYTHADPYWGEVLGCLMISYVFMMIGYVTGPLLNANGSIHKLNWIFLLSILFNVVLNFVLIAKFKAYGAALATLFTQGFVVLMQVLYVNRTADFSFADYPIGKMIFFALVTILFMVGLKSICTNWFQILLGISLYGLIVLFYLRFIFQKAVAQERFNLGEE